MLPTIVHIRLAFIGEFVLQTFQTVLNVVLGAAVTVVIARPRVRRKLRPRRRREPAPEVEIDASPDRIRQR